MVRTSFCQRWLWAVNELSAAAQLCRYKGLEKRGAIDLFFMILEKVVIYGECLAWG